MSCYHLGTGRRSKYKVPRQHLIGQWTTLDEDAGMSNQASQRWTFARFTPVNETATGLSFEIHNSLETHSVLTTRLAAVRSAQRLHCITMEYNHQQPTGARVSDPYSHTALIPLFCLIKKSRVVGDLKIACPAWLLCRFRQYPRLVRAKRDTASSSDH
jgi:hypothetical protein